MSNLTLSQQTYKWLQSIQLVKEGKRNSQGKMLLDEKLSGRFLDGVLISKILLKIIENESQLNQSLRNKMKSVKQNSTPAIRLYNWNLIVDVLKHYKFTLDYLQKSKILNLQPQPVELIVEYLRGIYYNQNNLKLTAEGKGQKVATVINTKGQSLLLNSNPSLNSPKHSNKLQIDIKSLPTRSAKQAQNILQLFTILLSKHFKLSPQQTLNLYLDNNKYLALLIVKGIKQSFEPILAFLNELISLLEFIVLEMFATNQQESLQFFFNCTKPCLISNSQNVTLNCLQLYESLCQTYTENNISTTNHISWLRKLGANTILFSTKQNDHILSKSLGFLFKNLQEELFQYVRPADKSALWSSDKQKLTFFHTFLVVAQNTLLDSFQKSTCLIQWKQYLTKSMKRLKQSQQLHLLISIINQLWLLYYQIFDKSNGTNGNNLLAENFFSLVKTVTVSNDFMLFVHCGRVMFELMGYLGRKKNSHAPTFYKMLCTCLQFQSSQQRVTFLGDNFIIAFTEIDSLPGQPIVQPLIKSLQRSPTVSTLNLTKYLIVNQKLPQPQCIQLTDIMMKVIFEDYLLGEVAIQNVFEALQVLDYQIREEFLLRNGMLCLAQFYSLAKLAKKSFFELQQSLRNYPHDQQQNQQQSQNHNYLTQIKRFLLIQNLIKFLSKIIQNHEEHSQITNQLQEHVFMTYLKVKIELKKPQIALILKNNIMNKYYDIDEELIAVTDQYQRRYRNYLQQAELNDRNNKKRSMSLQASIQSLHQQSSIDHEKFLEEQPNTISSPSKQLNPSLLKPTNFAMKDLQSLKSKLSRIKLATEIKQKESQLIQEKNNMLRSVINQRRMIRYGAKNTKDIEYKCIFDFDTVKPQKTINGLPIVQLTNLPKEQQDIFVADVQSLMKKYRKVWRFLFFKFSTFGAKNKTNITNSQTKIQQKINISQVWKMHKQYRTDFIKKQESFAIVKLVNEGMKRKNDLQNLTYLGFQQYIVQFCIFAYNRLGLTTLSPGQKVSKFLSQLREVTSEKGGNSEIFSNPEEVYFQETDVIKEYNRRLTVNPDYILPEGYKKVKQTQFIYEHEFTQNSKQVIVDLDNNNPKAKNKNKESSQIQYKQQSFIDVLQVLDSILSQHPSLGFHLIEPKTSKIQRTLAKPALFQQINQKMKTYKQGYLMPKKRQVNSTYIPGRQQQKIVPSPVIVKPEFHPLIQFSLGIKLGLSAVPLKNKYIGEQVAYWMDDMLDAVQNGSKKVENKAQKKIQNEAIKNKRRMLYNLKNQMKQKQKLYKQRSQSVRSQFEKIQLVKQQLTKKRIQQSIIKKKEQKLREQKQIKKKLAQFEKAKKFFSQRQQKQKQRQLQEQQAKRKQKQQYKKKVEEYFKLKKSQLQQKQLNFKKERQYEQKKQQQEEEKKKQFTKKAYLAVLKKDQQALQRLQLFKQKYEQFSKEEFVRRQFQQNRKSLTILFELLVKYEKSKISMTDKQQISQATFNYFALKFGVIPHVLEKNVLGKILISIWKSEVVGMKGMDYRTFEQALLRVIVKGKQSLNRMVGERRKKRLQNNSNYSQIGRSALVQTQKQPTNNSNVINKSKLLQQHQSSILQSQKLNKSMMMSKVSSSNNNSLINASKLVVNQNLASQYLYDPEGVTQETIRQFMILLNLPDDKLGVENRWRQVIENKHKVVSQQTDNRYK